jgi:hypothetical protein
VSPASAPWFLAKVSHALGCVSFLKRRIAIAFIWSIRPASAEFLQHGYNRLFAWTSRQAFGFFSSREKNHDVANFQILPRMAKIFTNYLSRVILLDALDVLDFEYHEKIELNGINLKRDGHHIMNSFPHRLHFSVTMCHGSPRSVSG